MNNYDATTQNMSKTWKFAKFSSSAEMCTEILDNTGVALLPGSDFGIDSKRMIARLSYTDFDGENFMKEYEKKYKVDIELISKCAPKVVEGIQMLRNSYVLF